MRLTDPIQTLPGVGIQNAKKLAKLGIFYLYDLLRHYPYRYDDLSHTTPIAELQPGGTYTIKAKIIKKKIRRIFRRHIDIVEITAGDDSGSVNIVWFNQPYLHSALKEDAEYLFAGRVSLYGNLQMQNPVWEQTIGETLHTGRVVPVYPLTAGIYPKWLRTTLKRLLDRLPELPDFLPEEIRKRNQLMDLDNALRAIHFPKDMSEARAARRRLAFEELLFYECKTLLNRKQLRKAAAVPIPFHKKLTESFVKKLPFRLTDSQRQAAWEIMLDISEPHPANRLLAGDVGSGKTVVAALAILQVLAAKSRAAILVPTEILAFQHFQTFCGLPQIINYNIGLVTGSKTRLWENGVETEISKIKLRHLVAEGRINLVIGTHALIQKSVDLKSLGLVIVDEQHRFGVQQRAYLKQAADTDRPMPHFLSMTATPIPRTLALSLYGDLEISRIRELPTGRRPVETHIVPPPQQVQTYKKIEAEIKSGRQVFVVCPIIDPSDALGVKSATETFEHLDTQIFPAYKVGLLHGRLSASAKDDALKKFREGSLNILVATTMVEVGVDFPNASVMVIVGAERFGLAQLHQLRGRVGRGSDQSYCYLFASEASARALERLQAMETINNGLELAEVDLKLRGPGELYGQAQSGYPEFRIADIFDGDTLAIARTEADYLLNKLNLNNYPRLAKKIKELQTEIHPE